MPPPLLRLEIEMNHYYIPPKKIQAIRVPLAGFDTAGKEIKDFVKEQDWEWAGDSVIMPSRSGMLEVPPGAWILEDGKGGWMSCSDVAFKASYKQTNR